MSHLYSDVVAVFHASFHPTKGNVVDWAIKISDDINLDGVEFNVLPSGLHLVERDTIHFSHSSFTGLAIYRRRPTLSLGHRGFRLSSLGILINASQRPRPWVHLDSLKAVADDVYGRAQKREEEDNVRATSDGSTTDSALANSTNVGDLRDEDFAPARKWFEDRKAAQVIFTPTEKAWNGWSEELDGLYSSPNSPTPHLPHLLRILGLSTLTLYKCILARRRIMIFTLPPVEVACILSWIAADLCRDHHLSKGGKGWRGGALASGLFEDERLMRMDRTARCQGESPRVLGMVTLNDLTRLEAESQSGNGWIACTTDAIFLEKPQYYDLIVDLTTSTPVKASRPTMYISKQATQLASGAKKKPGWKLESIRFTWSDVKLWAELDRILKLASSHKHAEPVCSGSSSHAHSHTRSVSAPSISATPPSPSKWGDMTQVYEDVCLLCASLWMGLGTWRSNSHESFSSANFPDSYDSANCGQAKGKSTAISAAVAAGQWGAIRLEGDEDWSVGGARMRSLGMGIEGKAPKGKRRLSLSMTRAIVDERDKDKFGKRHSGTLVDVVADRSRENSDETAVDGLDQTTASAAIEANRQNTQTTLALLQTFHANTVFILSRLHELLPPLSTSPSVVQTPIPHTPHSQKWPSTVELSSLLPSSSPDDSVDNDNDIETIAISARDMLSMELGILSEVDARFVEWLAEAEGYAGKKVGRKVVVRRGWSELVGILFGIR